MNYDEKWEILANFLIELKEKGKIVPIEIMNDLRSAKTIIQVLKSDPSCIETVSRIEKYLRNIESYAISTGEQIDKKIAEDWLKKLIDKKMEKPAKTNEKSKFIHGIPRNEKWVRIKILKGILPENLKKIVEENNLSYKTQKNDYIIVHGDPKNIKKLIKSITEQVARTNNE
jgi:hypothetical protein